MRIMTLSDMLSQLRIEARLSTNVAHGSHLTENYVALLRRVQEELYDSFDWPMLSTVQTVDVTAGSRYGSYPSQIAFEGICEAYSTDTTGRWFELQYGIEAEHLNLYDSDTGASTNTVWRWKHYVSPTAESLNQNMFEVWPIPDRDVKVRFEGKRALYPLVSDNDRSTLDGPLIVLHAAAELLAAQKAEDTTLKLQKAQQRGDMLKRRQSAPNNQRVNMAGGRSHKLLRPGIDYIP